MESSAAEVERVRQRRRTASGVQAVCGALGLLLLFGTGLPDENRALFIVLLVCFVVTAVAGLGTWWRARPEASRTE